MIISKENKAIQTFSSNNRTFVGEQYDTYIPQITPVAENRKHKFGHILLSPSVSGIFIHEICGHMLENDFFTEKNPFFNLVGQNICPSNICVYDNPNRLYKKIKHMDDEGNPLKKTPLIFKGKLVGLLGCRYSQTKYVKLPFANKARRESYKYVPTGRSFCIDLTNSNCHKLNFSKLKNVLLIKEVFSSCFVSSTNEIKCKSSELYLLGDNNQQYKIDGTFSIRIKGLDFLRNIISTYNDYTYHENMCYSSSGHVSTATYSPSILLDNSSFLLKIRFLNLS